MIDSDVVLGNNVRIFDPDLVNIFGCQIGDNTFIGPFVEITRGVVVGQNCLVESHSFICNAVTIEDDVFIGHGAMFTNDLYPTTGRRVVPIRTLVKRGASIGTNATIVAGVTIGQHSVIGAGSVVTRDVPDLVIAAGNPAKVRRRFDNLESFVNYISDRQPSKTQE